MSPSQMMTFILDQLWATLWSHIQSSRYTVDVLYFT